ncbi:hypothetical protein GCM10007362_22310 [Saccharibacillus endophyticus]|uniref:Uncharacterized protein n=1 Tax=Saccharibacillus endophyticus TaxID=2060666 RepID=A0ABQ1ZV26_9BACL|nr:hypothetical protein GCM10007362_22310 [Saccharibacillus endophyticus]
MKIFIGTKKSAFLGRFESIDSIEKAQRSWKREDGEKNSVQDAFELGKLQLKTSIDFSK